MELAQVTVDRLHPNQDPQAAQSRRETECARRPGAGPVEDLRERRERQAEAVRAVGARPGEHVECQAFVDTVRRVRKAPRRVQGELAAVVGAGPPGETRDPAGPVPRHREDDTGVQPVEGMVEVPREAGRGTAIAAAEQFGELTAQGRFDRAFGDDPRGDPRVVRAPYGLPEVAEPAPVQGERRRVDDDVAPDRDRPQFGADPQVQPACGGTQHRRPPAVTRGFVAERRHRGGHRAGGADGVTGRDRGAETHLVRERRSPVGAERVRQVRALRERRDRIGLAAVDQPAHPRPDRGIGERFRARGPHQQGADGDQPGREGPRTPGQRATRTGEQEDADESRVPPAHRPAE
ncbi:hypothetical protein GCM10023317_69100 [Actinopolymorpha pittospori]